MNISFNSFRKKVVIRAPLLSYSGYGTHSRQIFKWLLSNKGIDVYTQIVPWGITPWMINPDLEGGLVDEIMKRSQPANSYDVSIQVQLPNEWDSSLARQNIGVSAVVETDVCNPSWIESCNKMDHIIVPSEFTKSVLQNTGNITTKLSVIPESFYDDITNKDIEPIDLELDTKFNFLIFGQLTGNLPENDRKNILNTLKWLCEVFSDDPDVGIVIKTNSGRNTTIDKKITGNIMSQVISEIRPGPYPKIHMIHGRMSESEVASLYRHEKIKALVSFTRGEGFGLPILEAAASGMPIIATNWSAHTEFLKLGRYIPVKYNLVNLPNSRIDNNIFIPNAKWAEPDENDAKARLKKFRKSDSIPKKWAAELKEKLVKKYRQSDIEKIYDSHLGIYFE